jgi:hypothetical protein
MTTVAVATACSQCAAGWHPVSEYEPGRFLAAIHVDHVGELQRAGWTIVHDMYGDKGSVDVICPHIAATLET